MAIECARAFWFEVASSVELQAKFRAAWEMGELLNQAVALGRQHGFTFTAREALQILREFQDGELCARELDGFAGGMAHNRRRLAIG